MGQEPEPLTGFEERANNEKTIHVLLALGKMAASRLRINRGNDGFEKDLAS